MRCCGALRVCRSQQSLDLSPDGIYFVVVELPAETFRLLVESVQDYAIYLLAPDGTIQSWNAGAQRLKGYIASEIVGHRLAKAGACALTAVFVIKLLLLGKMIYDSVEAATARILW